MISESCPRNLCQIHGVGGLNLATTVKQISTSEVSLTSSFCFEYDPNQIDEEPASPEEEIDAELEQVLLEADLEDLNPNEAPSDNSEKRRHGKKKKKRQNVDAMAAAILLQTYLDSLA